VYCDVVVRKKNAPEAKSNEFTQFGLGEMEKKGKLQPPTFAKVKVASRQREAARVEFSSDSPKHKKPSPAD